MLESPAQRLDSLSDKLGASLISLVQTRRVALSEGAGALRPALLRRAVDGERRRLESLAARLNLNVLEADMRRRRRELDQMSLRLSDLTNRQIAGWRDRIDTLERLRKTVGYKETLKRGYAVIRAGEAVITTKAAASSHAALEIEFSDGRLALDELRTPKKRKQGKGKAVDPDQGNLL